MSDRRCWRSSAATRSGSLARPDAQLGLPRAKPMWMRALGDYIEFPPLLRRDVLREHVAGTTYAIDAETGKVRWRRQVGGTLPSSPAIDGPRVFVASQDGHGHGARSRAGRVLWRVQTGRQGRVVARRRGRSRLLRVARRPALRGARETGRVRWAYQTGGRINASPSVFGGRVCVTTYAGSFSASTRAPAASSGRRTSSATRSATRASTRAPRRTGAPLLGRALGQGRRARRADGDIVWTARSAGSATRRRRSRTAACSSGGFDGRLRALRATTGDELWSTWVGGRILGAPVVIGDLRLLLDARETHVRRCARPTARSSGGCRSAGTRRGSRPSGRTTSRSTAA